MFCDTHMKKITDKYTRWQINKSFLLIQDEGSFKSIMCSMILRKDDVKWTILFICVCVYINNVINSTVYNLYFSVIVT